MKNKEYVAFSQEELRKIGVSINTVLTPSRCLYKSIGFVLTLYSFVVKTHGVRNYYRKKYSKL